MFAGHINFHVRHVAAYEVGLGLLSNRHPSLSKVSSLEEYDYISRQFPFFRLKLCCSALVDTS